MRILLVSAHFPPYAPAAATRAPKLAQYWRAAGHEVRVLAAYRPKLPPILDPGLPPEIIHYAPMTDVNDWPGAVKNWLKSVFVGTSHPSRPAASEAGPSGAPAHAPPPSRARRWFDLLYNQLTNIPDQHVGWVRPAIEAGDEILAAFPADVIYVTAPPHSAFMVGARLAKRHRIPWLAEYRDAWVTNGYYDGAWFRKPFERALERWALASAAGIVGLTQTTSRTLGLYHDKPAEVAMNGFDPDDFQGAPPPPLDPARLTILYAGSIYVGKRDPSVLFQAMAGLGAERDRVRVHFYMDNPGNVLALADRHGVTEQVMVHAPVAHARILELERAADVLLLLRWDNPAENGVIAGKLFEYIGARRPILSIGSTTGEAAEIIRTADLGLVSKDVATVQAQLRDWLTLKASAPRLPEPDNPNIDAFARARQFDRVQAFIERLLRR
ncbi:MAG: hypothetical protein Tsb0016_06260 [Sphingomonadales bacterium]